MIVERLDQKVKNDVFGRPNRKRGLNFQGLWLLWLASEIFHVDPVTQADSISETMFFGSMCDFLAHTKQPKTKHFESSVLGTASEKIQLVIFGRAISICGTQMSLFKDETPVRKHVTIFWIFATGKKLVQPSRH